MTKAAISYVWNLAKDSKNALFRGRGQRADLSDTTSNVEWIFHTSSDNVVIVEKPPGDHASKGSHGDSSHAEADDNSLKVDSEVVAPPEDKAEADHEASVLKKNGAEKFGRDDFAAALTDFNAADAIQPGCVYTLKYRAEIKRILGRYTEALDDLNRADEIKPNDGFVLSTRGTVYKELQDYETALRDLDRADELDSNDYFVKTQRGVVKRSLRDFEGALEDLNHEITAQNPDQAYVLAQIGVVNRELGRLDEALVHLNRAHDLKPNNAFIYQQRGVVRRELQDLEGALNDLNMAQSIVPTDSYTLRRRGVTRRELLDYQGSLEDLNMANKLEPYNDLTLSERGVTKKLLADFQGALQDLCMANHIKGNQAFTLKHRGSANRELGNLDEALLDLTCAEHLDRNDFFTLLELGRTEKLSHQYKSALIHYNKVVELTPNDSSILRERGSLKRMLGDYKGALEDFNQVDEPKSELNKITIPTLMERCFTKYAMKDVAGAFEDAKLVRELLGVHGLSSIRGEQLKPATTCQNVGLSEHASAELASAEHASQRLKDIEKSTSSHILWIEHNKLLFLKDLGRGSYGYVQKCKWVEKNKEVAVKYVSSQIKDAFEYEVRMFSKIQHPRVVRLIGCSYDEEEKTGLLVMELMQWNLRSLIDSRKRENGQVPFELPVAVDIMTKIAEAMEYLHEQGVLHRDLKSSNVLVNKLNGSNGKEEYVVKIADFGMAKLQAKNNMPYFMTVDVGATLWRAPEVFKNEASQKYSFPADIWSYGITCYEILSGEVPFEGVTCAKIRHNVLCGLRPELPASCPSVLKSMLMKCWSLFPHDRPTFSDIHKTLKLYLGTISSRDFGDHKSGDAIRPHELRRH